MELEPVVVAEYLMDDQSVFAGDLVDLEPQHLFFHREGIGADSLPPVLQLLEVARLGRRACPLGGDVDGGRRVGAVVVVLDEPVEVVPERRRDLLRQNGVTDRGGGRCFAHEVEVCARSV